MTTQKTDIHTYTFYAMTERHLVLIAESGHPANQTHAGL
jgi:hypothetical protein